MSAATIQDSLPFVQMPSRYLGNEANRIKKPWESVNLHVALAFPDLYEIGTSHFGIQILYSILNEHPDILCERVFAPAIDMEAQLRSKGIRLSSLESARPVGHFDIVGFSLLYELNYTNMLNMIDLSGIALFSEQRGSEDPFVIAGGPCTCNPEPVADFFDAIVIGDGESIVLKMAMAWLDWKQSGSKKRNDLLKKWSFIKGIYIPSFFDAIEGEKGTQRLIAKTEGQNAIQREIIEDLDQADVPLRPVLPFGRPVHDRLRLEIARGCTRGCRFCQAGMIYRPVRERKPETIMEAARKALQQTGYEDISLLSLSTGDYSCIEPLMKSIMAFGRKDRTAVSLPSLRAGSLTPAMMDLIKKVRKTGFTIAPEAGSQRLRNVINKNITENDIIETVQNAFRLGWKVIKLYFMIGLPTERQADLQAIVDLVKKVQAISGANKGRRRINVSFATFVPKPHTPFQWESQIDLESALEKLKWLKDALNIPGIQVKWQDPRVSKIEAVWSRGDRKLGRVLVEAWKSGCRFDGWSDFFNYDRWISAFQKCGVDPLRYTLGWSDTTAPLAWDHIDIGVKRSYLIEERRRGYQNEITADCRYGDCSGCGVCDFSSIKPTTFRDVRRLESDQESPLEADTENNHKQIKYRIQFQKTGSARFLGHLEMMKLFIRSIRRANIPIMYSRGYHPMPKISFLDTLPMGMQSEKEILMMTLTTPLEAEDICKRLNRELPVGVAVVRCDRHEPGDPLDTHNERRYRIELKDGFFRQKDLESFNNSKSVTIDRKNKRGKTVTVDLSRAVTDIHLIDDQHAEIQIKIYDQKVIRPATIMKTVFRLNEKQILSALVTKINHV